MCILKLSSTCNHLPPFPSKQLMSLLVANAEAVSPERASRPTEASFTLTFTPEPREELSALCRRIATCLDERKATPLHFLVFGNSHAAPAGMAALEKSFGRVNFPVTWVEGADCGGKPVAGIQLYAFTGDVERIERHGEVVGSVFTEDGARQCFVGGLMHSDPTLPAAEQTRQTLGELQATLALAGFELADTVRTWFFLENILKWYDDFNRARTKIYSGVKFRTGSLPASTGVGAKNPAGSALALAAWAFRPLIKTARAEEIASPLQCPAPAYGSSFSRAMEIYTEHSRRLFISGTASIAPGGRTLWVGDVRKQIELSMDVVEAILRSRGCSFADVARATAYFRHPADAEFFSEWMAANKLGQMPVVAAQCDVCRDDLLFELEAEAERRF
jgi:enamine deaminase RidA (YjgF/YER057c/UK114 family)